MQKFYALLVILLLFLTTACSNEAPLDKQKESVQTWQTDFRTYSTTLNDYSGKYNIIVKKLSDGSMSELQAYQNLKDLDNKYLGFRLLLSDKFKVPEGLSDRRTDLLKKSKESFEDAIYGNHNAVKNLINYLDNPQPKYLTESRSLLDFAKTSYQQSLDYQRQLEKDLGIEK